MSKTPQNYKDRNSPRAYYENVVLHNRALVHEDEVMRCPSTNKHRTKCGQCVISHRDSGVLSPCLKPMVEKKLFEVGLSLDDLETHTTEVECPCPNDLCDWHGKHEECMALHAHHNDHIPYCFQPMLEKAVMNFDGTEEEQKNLAKLIEMELCDGVLNKKKGTPIEYRQYVRSLD